MSIFDNEGNSCLKNTGIYGGAAFIALTTVAESFEKVFPDGNGQMLVIFGTITAIVWAVVTFCLKGDTES